MTLNKKKATNLIQSKKRCDAFFFNLPTLSTQSYIQTTSRSNNINELRWINNDIYSHLNYRKSFCFTPAKKLQVFFTLNRFKQRFDRCRNIQKRLCFCNKVLKAKKRYKFFFLKRIKGGFWTSSLGFFSFMPRSLAKPEEKKKQFLIGIKILRRKKKFTFRNRLKPNLISSCKRKPARKRIRKKKTTF